MSSASSELTADHADLTIGSVLKYREDVDVARAAGHGVGGER